MDAAPLADRALIRLSPAAQDEDVRGFVQGLVTSDVKGALPVWAGLLTPQGKALFDFVIWADGEHLLLDCEASAQEALIRRLSLYRLRRAITIAPEPAMAVFWRAGPGDRPDPRLAALGQRWLGPAAPAAGDGSAAWRAHRLRAGVCEGRSELGDGETLWLECNAAELGGVSFTKGCYIGQENTARMNWRSTVNRRLVVLPLPESDPARRRAAYPELGLAVDHRRTADLPPDTLPGWLSSPGR